MNPNKLDVLEEIQREETSIDLRGMLAPYFYRWPLFLLATLMALAVALVYLRYSTPVYNVTSSLLIKDETKEGNNEKLNQLDLFTGSKVMDNEIEIFKSKLLMLEVVRRLHLETSLKSIGRLITVDVYEQRPVTFQNLEINPSYYGKKFDLSFPDSKTFLFKDEATDEVFKGEIGKIQHNQLGSFIVSATPHLKENIKGNFELAFLNPENVANDFISGLSVEPSTKLSSVLKIELKSTVPERGKDVLTTLIGVYNEASLKDKNKTVKNTIDFINDRLKLLTLELTDVEKNIETFKSTQGLTDISGDAASFLQSVKSTDAQLNEFNLKLEVIKNIRKSLNANFKADKLPSTLGIDDPVLVEQISKLYALESQKITLLATLPATNPVFKPINEQISNLKSNISSSLDALDNTLKNMRKSISGYNNRYENLIKKIPGQEREFISIKRQQSIKENLYLFLLQRKEEAILSYAAAAADTRIIEKAYAPMMPLSPNRLMILGGAPLTGLLLILIYVYIKELLNDRIKSVKDLKKLTTVPLLAELVQQADSKLITQDVRTAMAEQLRSLKSDLQYIIRKPSDGEGIITLLTSSMSGEGKSFVACNLAAINALSGKKTILLELDLRKPKITRYLNLKQKLGITNYLIGKANIAEIIQPLTNFTNLDIISSGPIPPNPAELLSAKEMETLLIHLKAIYDEIIIDTPPIGLVTDAGILGKFADVTLFLVRQKVTFKTQVANIAGLKTKKKLPNVNIILNGVKQTADYGYGYYANEQGVRKASFKAYLKDFKNRLF